MMFVHRNKIKSGFGLAKCVGLGLTAAVLSACGASTPELSAMDTTPPDFYEGAKVLQDTHLIELAARNPLFDITDNRGIHYGTVALTAGEQATAGLPSCPTAIPGPLAPCTLKGARIVNGRLSVGVAEFGGETGLYYIDKQAICFSSMVAINGCHELSIRYDQTIEVKTSYGANNLWILRGA